jgi:hypothetical protein
MASKLGQEINYAYIPHMTPQFTSSYLLSITSLPTQHSYRLPEEQQGFPPMKRARNCSYTAPYLKIMLLVLITCNFLLFLFRILGREEDACLVPPADANDLVVFYSTPSFWSRNPDAGIGSKMKGQNSNSTITS